MKKCLKNARAWSVAFPISALSLAVSQVVSAQEGSVTASPPVMEEVLILGRMKSNAFDIVSERMELEVAADLVDAEMISRVGDSTVASALRRMPGVTLVSDKYVYVRGLGERYSSTTLNGATVPSPDLSRNVLPLDIFPTSIVESLSVQKVFSADMPASFGGGSVDIRTRGAPQELTFFIELGTKMNTESRASALDYDGGDDDRWGTDDGTRALSSTLDTALDTYWGDFNPNNIAAQDKVSLDAAEATNRELLTELYRDINVYTDDTPREDITGSIGGGNIWDIGDDWTFGVLAGADYERTTRSKERTFRILGIPEQGFTTQNQTTHHVSITGDLSFALNFGDANRIETTSLYIRNTDDDVGISDILNTNRQLSGGMGFREYDIRFEERELVVNQIHGEHELTWDILDRAGLDFLEFAEGLQFNWYYSDSEATTDIPSEVKITSDTTVDTTTAAVLTEHVGRFASSANYRFTDMEDYVESYGYDVRFPFELGGVDWAVSAGSEYWQKTRIYKQTQMYIDTTEADLGSLYGPLNSVFSDSNVTDPDNGMLIRVAADNEDSYMAANKVLSSFGKLDATFSDTLRVVAGVRWEDYQQVNLPWNPLNYDGSQIVPIPYDDPEAVADYFDEASYIDDDTYGSLALTYMVPDFWAEDFQLRASYGETTVRPDLREISPGSFRDPITDILVFGNPDVVPSKLENYDLRAEWFFSTGDSFTTSLFYKDITDPIEMFATAASDDTIAAEIINAESGTISGIEFEFLKNLESISDVLSPFFVQGNLTFLDTEIVAGAYADAPTNPERPMNGASEQSGNLILGFDSPDEMHAATLSLNYFSERLFYAGRNGREDTYEQPYTSLDFTYSFYPIDQITVKFKAQNILDETLEINQEGNYLENGQTVTRDVTILEQKIGQTLSLDIQYRF